MNKVLMLMAALAVLFSAPAMAQEESPAKDAAADAAADAPEAAETAADAAAEDDSATEAEKDLEKDMEVFYGKRRRIKVVEKRLFEKDGRLDAALVGGIIPNDDFLVYYPVIGRVGYNFSEAFSVEATFAYAFDQNTELTTFLEDTIGLKRADIQEIISLYYGVNILWAPIYGKIGLLGSKLTHFETYIGVGGGVVHTTEFEPENPAGNEARKPAGNTVVGFRWFITDLINIRTEYRHFFFEKFGGGISTPVELSLGLGFTI
jgi:outer membrane beta-barrel protein